jgi:hypothetical protein
MAKFVMEQYKSIGEMLKDLGREKNPYMKLADSSNKKDSSFSGTASFEEAYGLLHHGDPIISKKLTTAIDHIRKNQMQNTKKLVPTYDVCGYQASVPRYLQGMPTSMINSKKVATQKPVIHLVKSISYSAYESTESILQNSIKALEIVAKLEAQGYRVSLDILWSVYSYKTTVGFSVKIKTPDERLNIAKMGFPIAHPSMLRRIGFRWLETTPLVDKNDFARGYGMPVGGKAEIEEFLSKAGYHGKPYILPPHIQSADQWIEQFVKNK